MKFGPVPTAEAEGALLAHSLQLPGRRLKKGLRLDAEDVAALLNAGISEITAAVLDRGDLTEDEAAARIGLAAMTAGIRSGPAATGRVNFFATLPGLFLPDREAVDAVNAVHPGITLATLAAYAPMQNGAMVATIKIIPLAVPGDAVEAACEHLAGRPVLRVAPFRARRVALIQTELPTVRSSVLDKTRSVLGQRLQASGSAVVSERRCAHMADPLARAIEASRGADITVIFGASAVIDGGDVVPAAIEAAGGVVRHVGMPVDPGNLLLLGEVAGRPVIGAPGCARSPKENGFDWVLNRILADVPIGGEDIRRMGVGGLLMEIASRPQPRTAGEPEPGSSNPGVEIVILAAGRSSRMGGSNKLLATFEGVPLIRRSAETALASRARRVRVVVGHMRDEVAAALAGLDLELVENPAFADGLSTSLIAGFEASLASAGGVLVMLADQPLLRAADLDRLIQAFRPSGPGSIVLATSAGKRGNPVLFSAVYRSEVLQVTGDVGARAVVAAHADAVVEVEIGAAASVDVDTPEALQQAGGVLG